MRYWPAILLCLLLIAPAVTANNLDANESKRVIVLLNDAPAKNFDVSALNANAEASEEIISQLENSEILDVYESFEGFSAIVSEEDLEKLKAMDVEVIEDLPVFQVSLDESVPFIGANNAWAVQISGINVTGKDYSVCVIDTGVNDSHPALAGRVIAQYDFCADNVNCTTNDSVAEDLHGHGTHVAGIIASNDSTYTGVAPEANLIIMKAGNSSGTIFSAPVVSAVDWCVAHKSEYNITAISMSFGGGAYNSVSACEAPSGYAALNAAFESAYSAGITLIAASGNDNSAAYIDYPSCHNKVISVGAVENAADVVASYSNSNSLLDLLAPGSNINSASKDGGFVSYSGTSMATPHVAGAVLLVAQYYKLKTGNNITPAQLEAILKNTGVNVTDARNGLSFPRINLTAATAEDISAPTIILESPENESVISKGQILNFTIIDNVLADTVLAEWNGTNVTFASPYDYNTSSWPRGENNITIYANDTIGNLNSSFFVFTVNNSAPTFQSNQPNSTYTVLITKQLNITANATDADGDEINYSIITNATGNISNITSGGAIIWRWTPNSTQAGNYYVQFNASDGINETLVNSTITVRPNHAPSLNSIADQTATAGKSKTITFTASDSDLTYGDSLSWSDNTSLFSTTSCSGTTCSVTFTPDESGTYYVKITVTDSFGSEDEDVFKLTVSSSSSTPRSGLDDENEIIINYDDERSWPQITPNMPIVWYPDTTTAVERVIFAVKTDVVNVIAKIRGAIKPSGASMSDVAYQYFELLAVNLANSAIDKITIRFNVPKSWMTSNKIGQSKIYLARWTGSSWEKLPTGKISETELNFIYEANTTHLSTFVIAGEKTSAVTSENTENLSITAQQKSWNTGSMASLGGEIRPEAKVVATIAVTFLLAVIVLLKGGVVGKFTKKSRKGAKPVIIKKKKSDSDLDFDFF